MKMKNKKAEQIASKKKRKEDQRRAKRRNAPNLDREEPTKPEKPTILIVCEGKNTEPSYFRQFRLTTATIKTEGDGYNTISLVNKAIKLASKEKYEQVWCVFDKDDFRDIDFNKAILKAEAYNFGVAYSNQAFEYWIILHFEDHQGGGMLRGDYHKKINHQLKEFKLEYKGKSSKKITKEIFDILEGVDSKTGKIRRELAIERAKRNYDMFDHLNCAKEESSTTVFKLVEEIQKYV